MDVFINDREVGALDGDGATVGELIEALGVHIDPNEIVTTVHIDGVAYSAGEEERYTRRGACGVQRLVIETATPAAFAVRMRSELARALEIIAAKVAQVVDLFERREERDANALLAALLEELRLALVLEQQVTTLDGAVIPEAGGGVMALAPELLRAQERRAWPELASLLGTRLVPALQVWQRAEERHSA